MYLRLVTTCRENLKFLLSHFDFARSLRSAYSFDFFEAAPAKEVGEAGEKTSAFEMVLFPAKTAELKFYLHSEKFKLHLLALYVCKIHYLFPPSSDGFRRP